MSLDEQNIKSLLIIDDNEQELELYSTLLGREIKAKIVTSKFPTEALNYAERYLFDIILIDITINYNGSPFGGFEIYKSLVGRYGDSSLIAYSKYITDDLLKQYNYNFNFIEKSANTATFIKKMLSLITSYRSNQNCFIAMPFEDGFDPVFKIIRNCIERSNYKCIRLDKETFNKNIVQRIFEEIKGSKFLIFLTAGKNPNAFYECGYAHALNKEVITITDYYDHLPFNIRALKSIEYHDELDILEAELQKHIVSLTEIRDK